MPAVYGEIVDGISFLSVDDLTKINRRLIEMQTPNEQIKVIKPNELSSSQARPNITRYYKQTEDIFCLCAVLIESLIINHPFANANKRTAMTAGAIFLQLNGYELTAPNDNFVKMAERIAIKIYNIEYIENWLSYWSQPFDSRVLCAEKGELPHQ